MSKRYDWNALADQAERGELTTIEGTTVTGKDAAARGVAALLASTETDSIEDATRVALGRPRLGEDRDTRLWRVRTTAQLDAAVVNLAKRQGRSRSEIIRAAVAEYAQAHG